MQLLLNALLSNAVVVFIVVVVGKKLFCLMGVTKYYTKEMTSTELFDLIIFAWFLSNPPDTGESKNDV